MKKLMNEKQAAKLDDCEVWQGHQGQKMEIALKASTKIGMSPKKFDFSSNHHLHTCTRISLVKLPCIFGCIKLYGQ